MVVIMDMTSGDTEMDALPRSALAEATTVVGSADGSAQGRYPVWYVAPRLAEVAVEAKAIGVGRMA